MLILILSLQACGKQGVEHTPELIDSEFKQYVDHFESVSGIGINYNILFNTLESNILGRCLRYSDGNRQIEINIVTWKMLDKEEREELLMHELGHCSLDKRHNEEKLENKCPKSIMYPYGFGYPCYTLSNVYYENELLGR